jgi:hypothetical protein
MERAYNIVVSIRTPQGMLEVGNFYLGTNEDFANSVFDNLHGDLTADDDALIRRDLEKEAKNMLPVRLKRISCTLNQYAQNCKIITRDVFKFFALEP